MPCLGPCTSKCAPPSQPEAKIRGGRISWPIQVFTSHGRATAARTEQGCSSLAEEGMRPPFLWAFRHLLKVVPYISRNHVSTELLRESGIGWWFVHVAMCF